MRNIICRYLWVLCFSVLVCPGVSPARTDQDLQSFLDAVKLYESLDYAEAAGIFETLARAASAAENCITISPTPA